MLEEKYVNYHVLLTYLGDIEAWGDIAIVLIKICMIAILPANAVRKKNNRMICE